MQSPNRITGTAFSLVKGALNARRPRRASPLDKAEGSEEVFARGRRRRASRGGQIMALIKSFEHKSMDRNSVHDRIDATYTTFERDGRKFIQVDSYGRAEREMPGKTSQTFQLDEKSARELFDILRDCFRFC
jgi:hypothetical protein